ncbi:MAG: DUF2238 domain-containing protein [Chromatiales bacterium]|nr:DUF2238 domain-containing protein [Chromatiales bacterium]
MHATPGRRPSATPGWLLAAFVCIWLWLAIAPRYRADWLLENVIVFIALPLFIRGARSWRFSDAWARALTGQTVNDALGWDRNHYDRLVHFAYGLL